MCFPVQYLQGYTQCNCRHLKMGKLHTCALVRRKSLIFPICQLRDWLLNCDIWFIFVSDLRYCCRTGGCIGQGSPSSLGPQDHRPLPRSQSLGLYQLVARRSGLQCHHSSQSSRSGRVEKAWPASSPREDWLSLPCHGERVWCDATSRSRR